MNMLERLIAFNSSRHRLWQENAAFAATVPRGAMLLDAGAGNAPYRGLFSHASYESADRDFPTAIQRFVIDAPPGVRGRWLRGRSGTGSAAGRAT